MPHLARNQSPHHKPVQAVTRQALVDMMLTWSAKADMTPASSTESCKYFLLPFCLQQDVMLVVTFTCLSSLKIAADLILHVSTNTCMLRNTGPTQKTGGQLLQPVSNRASCFYKHFNSFKMDFARVTCCKGLMCKQQRATYDCNNMSEIQHLCSPLKGRSKGLHE